MRLLSRLIPAALALCAAVFSVGAALAVGEKGEKVKVGDKAPKFDSVDDQGKPWHSSDVVGKKILVLYFYPADFTGGCTKQACGFRDNIEKLHAEHVEVVGVSGDAPETHMLFKKHEKLNFTLLADEKGELATLFGVPHKLGKAKAGGFDDEGKKIDVFRNATIQRWTVVIDKTGHIAAIDAVGNAAGDAGRVEALVKKLETK